MPEKEPVGGGVGTKGILRKILHLDSSGSKKQESVKKSSIQELSQMHRELETKKNDPKLTAHGRKQIELEQERIIDGNPNIKEVAKQYFYTNGWRFRKNIRGNTAELHTSYQKNKG